MKPAAPYTYTPKPRSRAWVGRVGALLRDGYGSEDIALALACKPEVVRGQVEMFRQDGLLRKWWPNA